MDERLRHVLLFALGVAIIVRGIWDHQLTPVELGAALALLGLIPVTINDRRQRNGD